MSVGSRIQEQDSLAYRQWRASAPWPSSPPADPTEARKSTSPHSSSSFCYRFSLSCVIFLGLHSGQRRCLFEGNPTRIVNFRFGSFRFVVLSVSFRSQHIGEEGISEILDHMLCVKYSKTLLLLRKEGSGDEEEEDRKRGRS